MKQTITNKKILVTGGAGFIGSNIIEYLLQYNNKVVCLDNLATGKLKNIKPFFTDSNFKFIEGDITNLKECENATKDIEIVLHQAAIGSVPRSINDPITTNKANIDGFLNMLVAARDNKVGRFVYAASSSTYGDNYNLPKIEENIGRPLSPYAITKYVNELYADVFAKTYGMELIGLRYFNVFGKHQDPNGAYAAVIPKFISLLINHKQPVINGDGSYSRDFTYIENVVQANILAATTEKTEALNQVYNVAYGEKTSLIELVDLLKEYLSVFDPKIKDIMPIFGETRLGDIPHSLASIDKAKRLLNYNPQFNVKQGLKDAIEWYFKDLKLKC